MYILPQTILLCQCTARLQRFLDFLIYLHISILHEHLTTKTKKFIACEPKISSAASLCASEIFDGSLRWNF